MHKCFSENYTWVSKKDLVSKPFSIKTTLDRKIILSKKNVKLAVVRNRIKRVVRSLVSCAKEKIVFFRVNKKVDKRNCESMLQDLKTSFFHLVSKEKST